ncbi:MAG TPA: acyl-CoA thioesterase domain-containing protein [Polyangiales bacterium]|nr:acyl-CoA thioesterase domain-containing protein [Polyangiales bacterium]
MQLSDLLKLADHGPDTWVGSGPSYPWGGLYGGQIVAQALKAASHSVPNAYAVHSLHAYFIRRGDASAPIRFEVDRIRDGRSFFTRRVVARQSTGAILNMSASFQLAETGAEVQTEMTPGAPPPESLPNDSWSPIFDRRTVPSVPGSGRGAAWFRILHPIDDTPVEHACALAYASDDLPMNAVIAVHPAGSVSLADFWVTSLDHAIWFHRPLRAERWHLYDYAAHALGNNRGLTLGHIFNDAHEHIATVAQELLVRPRRESKTP